MSGSYLSAQIMWSKDVCTFNIAERLRAISAVSILLTLKASGLERMVLP